MAGAIMMCAGLLLPLSAHAGRVEDSIAAAEAFNAKILGSVGQGKRVYFAGPMFNQAEKDFNLRLTKVLEACGYQVFLPQRDGIEAAMLQGKTEEELVRMIFSLDAEEVKKADIVFMNVDGRVPDEGACVELGLAYGLGKRCYGFKTDTHSVELGLDVNPMLTGCMIRFFRDHDGNRLIEEIREYLSGHAL